MSDTTGTPDSVRVGSAAHTATVINGDRGAGVQPLYECDDCGLRFIGSDQMIIHRLLAEVEWQRDALERIAKDTMTEAAALAERVRRTHAPTQTVGYRSCSDPECPRHRQRHRHRYTYMACAWGCGVVRSTESGECEPYRLASAVINRE